MRRESVGVLMGTGRRGHETPGKEVCYVCNTLLRHGRADSHLELG